MAIFLESFCTLMFLFPKAVVDENFKSIACRERHLRSSCQFMLFRNCYVCAGVSIAHSRHVRSCCMQLKFPGGAPADALLARLWLGKAGARCPNIAGQGKVLGLCRFLRKRSVRRVWGPLPLRLLRFGKAAGERCPDRAGQGQVLGLCCFLGQKLAIVARALGWPCCLRLPKLSLGVGGRRACELHVAQI